MISSAVLFNDEESYAKYTFDPSQNLLSTGEPTGFAIVRKNVVWLHRFFFCHHPHYRQYRIQPAKRNLFDHYANIVARVNLVWIIKDN